MSLEQDIKDLTAEMRISNALRREDLDFRKQLYATAANTAPTATAEAPAPKKPAKAKPEVVKTPEPSVEPEEANVPPTEPANPDPAPTEPHPEPVAEEAPVEVVEKTTIEDVLNFQRSLLKDTSVEEKKSLQTKLREVLAEFGAKATTELKPEQLGAALARMKEVVG
jgi:outer membrane biosynthesis protein TonB